jgi:hypothetical protein
MKKVEIKKYRYPIASLTLGTIGLIAWIIPILGAPIAIVGLVLGVKGHKSSKKSLATAGIVLCIIGLFASVANVSIGAYRGATGELFTSSGGVIFCENVDENLNVINASTSFAAGDVYVRLKTSSKFNTTKIKITTYKINGIKESIFDSAEQVVNQDWTVIAVPITFEEPGTYKVLFTKVTDVTKLGEGTVTIK